jgi:hypothetical protein
MPKKHHALQIVAELLNDVKQVIHRAGIQPVFDHDILALVIELFGDDLRCRERAPNSVFMAVCMKNLIRSDCGTESYNIGDDGCGEVNAPKRRTGALKSKGRLESRESRAPRVG